jgi:uncharacterized membrane protein
MDHRGSPLGWRLVYHALLFFHVLSAFLLFGAVVIYSAFVLGAPVDPRARMIAEILWGVGGVGTLALGIWLALYLDAYKIYDGWIIAAIVLWFLATGTGARTSRELQPATDGGPVAIDSRTAAMHWLRTLFVVVLLLVMVYKPGA